MFFSDSGKYIIPTNLTIDIKKLVLSASNDICERDNNLEKQKVSEYLLSAVKEELFNKSEKKVELTLMSRNELIGDFYLIKPWREIETKIIEKNNGFIDEKVDDFRCMYMEHLRRENPSDISTFKPKTFDELEHLYKRLLNSEVQLVSLANKSY